MTRAVMRKSTVLPDSPEGLLQQLLIIFPEYRAGYSGPIHDQEPSFHSVLIAFSTSFGGLAKTASEEQLRSFGQLVSSAVEASGLLGNAFGTCLLEHLHQTGALQALRPYLSKAAREKTSA